MPYEAPGMHNLGQSPPQRLRSDENLRARHVPIILTLACCCGSSMILATCKSLRFCRLPSGVASQAGLSFPYAQIGLLRLPLHMITPLSQDGTRSEEAPHLSRSTCHRRVSAGAMPVGIWSPGSSLQAYRLIQARTSRTRCLLR
jgi:hypothetical protein